MNSMRVIIIDDEKGILNAIKRVFYDSEYTIDYFSSPKDALKAIKNNIYNIVVTDYRMPDINGMEILMEARKRLPKARRILMTGYSDIDVIIDAINNGNITKYISKPWDNKILREMIEEVVEECKKESDSDMLLHEVLKEKSEWKSIVDDLERKLYQINEQGINALMKVIESKDPELMGHSVRVSEYALLLGRSLGLNNRSLDAIKYASMFHDIGKIAIRDSVLYKEGSLDKSEYDEMMHHPKVGSKILLEMEFMKEVSEIVYQHHERYDGSGYPERLCGENISIEARIVGIADFYDALTSKRSYKEALSKEVVLNMLISEKNRQFDEDLVEKFVVIMG